MAQTLTRRCPYCHGEFIEVVGQRVSLHTTADLPPPADHTVRINGVLVHHCQRGNQLPLD